MGFIESTSTQQGMPPFRFPGVSITSFLLAADIDRLTEYCDRFLNIDPRRRFTPLAPYVYLGLNQYPKMFSEHPDQVNAGYMSQNEYYVMFPVVRHDAIAGNFLLARELSWAFPFIGVDNPASAFSGQEVLGFPKLVGVIAMETAADRSFSATVEMPGFRVISPNSAGEMLPLINVRTGPPLTQPPPQAHAFPWSFMGLGGVASVLDEVSLALLSLLSPGISSVTNLKQFRDPVQPTQAAYQALVRCEWKLENGTPPTVYDGAEIDIFDNATLSIVESLGLTANGSRVSPELAIGLTTDMWFGNAQNLFVA